MRGLGRAAGLVVAALILASGAAAQTKSAAPAKKAAAPLPYKRALLNPAALVAKAPAEYEARFTTTKGDFVVKVTRDWAPLGADRFYNLVKNGYYDGAAFFRVLDGFVAQVGISAYPRVNAAWQKAVIKDDPVKTSNRRGTVTFATGGRNTRTTQIFINYADRNSQLDSSGFSPFGQVIEGMDVVDRLYSGYGEGAPQGRGPDQERIQTQGATYLDKEFPKLDKILQAVISSPAPAEPAKAPAKKTP